MKVEDIAEHGDKDVQAWKLTIEAVARLWAVWMQQPTEENKTYLYIK